MKIMIYLILKICPRNILIHSLTHKTIKVIEIVSIIFFTKSSQCVHRAREARACGRRPPSSACSNYNTIDYNFCNAQTNSNVCQAFENARNCNWHCQNNNNDSNNQCQCVGLVTIFNDRCLVFSDSQTNCQSNTICRWQC